MEKTKLKLIIAVTGASGSIYAKSILEELIDLQSQCERIDLIFSKEGKEVWEYELPHTPFESFPFNYYDNSDFFAPCASGSSNFDAMIICPCSMGTLGRIANGISSDLIGRTADVMLKERKKLIIVPRESPLNHIHLQNMLQLTQAGAIIMPASPSFYHLPNSLDELIETISKKTLTMAGIRTNYKKWGE